MRRLLLSHCGVGTFKHLAGFSVGIVMTDAYFKGLGLWSWPLFVFQRAMPVGIVGGPDLSAIPNPPVIRSTSPVLSPRFFAAEQSYLVFMFNFSMLNDFERI